MPKTRMNRARFSEGFQWSMVVCQILLAVVNVAISHYLWACTNLAFAVCAAAFALNSRDQAFLADHNAVVRVYKNGQLENQLPLNFAPGQFLAQVEVSVAKGCTCGQTHDAETVVREPHKDEL